MNNKTSSHRGRNIDPIVIFSEDIMKLFDRGAEAIANELREKLGAKGSKTCVEDCGCEGNCGTECKCSPEDRNDAGLGEKAMKSHDTPLLIVHDKNAVGVLPFLAEVKGSTVEIKLPTLFHVSEDKAIVEFKEMDVVTAGSDKKRKQVVSVKYNLSPPSDDELKGMNSTCLDMGNFFMNASLNVALKDGYEIIPESIHAEISKKSFQGLILKFDFKPKTKEQRVFRVTIN